MNHANKPGKLSSFATVPVAKSTVVQAIGPNPRRCGLSFSPPSQAGQFCYAPRPLSSLGEGFSLSQGSSPLDLRCDVHGSIVKDAWWVLNTNIADDIACVIEVSEEG